ncbi:hypothetical protein GO284_04058 [Ralstonia solanacearum]|nr:hypothetical protein [Ralstonia solanacearum]
MTTNAKKPSGLRENFDAERIGKELEALQPDDQELERARILELFPRIKAAKERGVSTKQILSMLGSHGLKLSAPTFRKLYEDASREHADEQFRKFVEAASRGASRKGGASC